MSCGVCLEGKKLPWRDEWTIGSCPLVSDHHPHVQTRIGTPHRGKSDVISLKHLGPLSAKSDAGWRLLFVLKVVCCLLSSASKTISSIYATVTDLEADPASYIAPDRCRNVECTHMFTFTQFVFHIGATRYHQSTSAQRT
jgi:hypothetical protein